MKKLVLTMAMILALAIPAHAAPRFTLNRGYRPLVGTASYYGPWFHGRPTASGRIFNQWELTAAHRSLPFGTIARVTNLKSGIFVDVMITDRGPMRLDRIIDLSTAAARKLGFSGLCPVKVQVLQRGG